MTAPTTQIVQMEYHNPDASMPLYVPVAVICNTSDKDLERNIRLNSARDLEWIKAEAPHDGIAVVVGGGPSLEEHVQAIIDLQKNGGTVFAMNGASKFLRKQGARADYQVIADAKKETAQLIDFWASEFLFASQVHPECFDKVGVAKVWHLEIGAIERWFPDYRVKRGGYALVGGGAAVGNAALCLAYTMGFRELHIFGYDSSHREDCSHAYEQPMNQFIPCVDVEWGGRKFTSSVAMKAQAEKFQITAQQLKQAGCELHLYGDGLLQTMYLTPPKDLSERDKYRLMWQLDSYREMSPGERAVETFLHYVKPEGMIVDFGCGTGRASLALRDAGHDLFLIDFADNCRDEEALCLPFLEWDLCHPIPVSANYGFCADVMEHIPADDVETVIRNIMQSARKVFFQIAVVPDSWGALIGQQLHMTVRAPDWWRDLFLRLGCEVEWQDQNDILCQFVVSNKSSEMNKCP